MSPISSYYMCRLWLCHAAIILDIATLPVLGCVKRVLFLSRFRFQQCQSPVSQFSETKRRLLLIDTYKQLFIMVSAECYLVSSWRKSTRAASTERTRCLQWRLSLIKEANSSTYKRCHYNYQHKTASIIQCSTELRVWYKR